MIVGVNHTSFTVSNLERSLAFYRDLLGLPVINITERPREFSEKVTAIPGAHLRIAYLDAHGHRLELIHYLSPPGKKLDVRTCDVGSAHLAFNVTNLRDMYRDMVSKGVKFKSEPLVVPAGPNKGWMCVYLENPDGVVLEFIQPANPDHQLE